MLVWRAALQFAGHVVVWPISLQQWRLCVRVADEQHVFTHLPTKVPAVSIRSDFGWDVFAECHQSISCQWARHAAKRTARLRDPARGLLHRAPNQPQNNKIDANPLPHIEMRVSSPVSSMYFDTRTHLSSVLFLTAHSSFAKT